MLVLFFSFFAFIFTIQSQVPLFQPRTSISIGEIHYRVITGEDSYVNREISLDIEPSLFLLKKFNCVYTNIGRLRRILDVPYLNVLNIEREGNYSDTNRYKKGLKICLEDTDKWVADKITIKFNMEQMQQINSVSK